MAGKTNVTRGKSHRFLVQRQSQCPWSQVVSMSGPVGDTIIVGGRWLMDVGRCGRVGGKRRR
jgi:hypothetical protein